jgi:predicted Zn-dependent protease
VVLLLFTLSGCATLLETASGITSIATSLRSGETQWALALQGVETLGEVMDAANSPFTPEQEYFVGRSVAATILDQYPPYTDEAANLYVNQLGQSLALASDRPEIYNGYVFQILDTDEINAFASPGGHIFVSRGMLALAESEDEVAAVLAHEIAHVVHRHGLGSIRSARVIGALQDGALQAIDTVSGEELQELTAVFADTTSEVIDTLVTRGYSGATEREADGSATVILQRLGYDPFALTRLLERMDEAQRAQYEGDAEPVGFSVTHPRPQSRINDLLATDLNGVEPGGRINRTVADQRFEAELGDF